MDIRIIKESPIQKEERQVVKCVHCKGSGICKNAVRQKITKALSAQVWMECNLCGKGTVIIQRELFSSYPPSPVCKVCKGTGYVVL